MARCPCCFPQQKATLSRPDLSASQAGPATSSGRPAKPGNPAPQGTPTCPASLSGSRYEAHSGPNAASTPESAPLPRAGPQPRPFLHPLRPPHPALGAASAGLKLLPSLRSPLGLERRGAGPRSPGCLGPQSDRLAFGQVQPPP